MPANQIMLGVPAYGYLQISSANSLRTRDSVTLRNAVGGTADGQIQYRSLVEQGALALDGSGRYVGAGGFTRQWDWCSSTVSGDFQKDMPAGLAG
jgi:chitinase